MNVWIASYRVSLRLRLNMEKGIYKVLLCVLLNVALGLGDRDAANIERSMMDIFKSNRCGDGKECVLRSLCDQSGGVIRDGRNLISLRSLYEVNNRCNWSEVCCSVNNKKPNVRLRYFELKYMLTDFFTEYQTTTR